MEHNDVLYWRNNFRGCYTVRCGYKLFTESGLHVAGFHAWNKLWKINVAPKICNFLWCCVRLEALSLYAVPFVVQKLRWILSVCCVVAKETVLHLVLEFHVVKQVWVVVGSASIFTGQHFNPWLDNFFNSVYLSSCY